MFANEDDIAVLEELALLLGVVNDVVGDLLQMEFIPVAFHIPTIELIKKSLEDVQVTHCSIQGKYD